MSCSSLHGGQRSCGLPLCLPHGPVGTLQRLHIRGRTNEQTSWNEREELGAWLEGHTAHHPWSGRSPEGGGRGGEQKGPLVIPGARPVYRAREPTLCAHLAFGPARPLLARVPAGRWPDLGSSNSPMINIYTSQPAGALSAD